MSDSQLNTLMAPTLIMKLLILFLLFCGAMALNQAEKPSGTWQKLSDRSLVFYSTPATWASALMHCLAMGGHLVVINNEEEEHFVKGLAEGKETWIGLTDAQQSGYWFWINSEPLGYTNWCPGEPNNKGGHQHCALTNYSGQKCWDDQSCDTRHPYVCERN